MQINSHKRKFPTKLYTIYLNVKEFLFDKKPFASEAVSPLKGRRSLVPQRINRIFPGCFCYFEYYC
jgi:hypothetical protein